MLSYMNGDRLLTPTQVAERLNVSLRTLRDWRYQRRNLAWLGERHMVRYEQSEVDRYIAKLKGAAPKVRA
jgi:uncharacterized protein YjcR